MEIKTEQLERVDRQTRVLGLEATKALSKGKCLIFNCGGLGVEIAKSVILMGMGSVHIIDDNEISDNDRATHFFCGNEQIGTRGNVSAKELAKLNKYCNVKSITNILMNDAYQNAELIKKYDVIVITDEILSEEKVVQCNALCRKHGVRFIYATTLGVFAAIFNDFGDNFIVNDLNGEKPNEGVIVNFEIDEEGNGIVDVHDQDKEVALNLYTGDQVKLINIKGMGPLNGTVRTITRTGMFKFSIGNVQGCGDYQGGGYFEEVKKEKKISFTSLDEYLKNPTSTLEYGKYGDVPKVIHAMHRVFEYKNINGVLPRAWHEEDALQLLDSSYDVNFGVVDEHLIKKLSYTCRGVLNPMVTFIGGIVGQEVQKAITGKFHPIHRAFYYEATEVLPASKPALYDVNEIKGRYQSQEIIFGKEFQKEMGRLSYFMIGAGALGCELLKNFAMMGVGCGQKGRVIVTDMDSIEVSNLSRQFLFREEHVGMMKSICAAEAAKEMNPKLNCEARVDRLGAETQNIYNDKFWNSLNGAITALDNVPTRKYVDEKCVFHHIPMIDSGTLGTKAHVQVVDPLNKTECYRSKKEQPIEEFAFCTVHVNPNIIEHTITWAKNYFVGTFNQNIQEANKFLDDSVAYLKSDEGNNMISLESIYYSLIKNKPTSFEDCIQWARQTYQDLFDYGIRNLLLTYPEDRKTKSGAYFWSGSKRCPKPIPYDENDEMTKMFIEAASRHYATLYDIPIENVDFVKVASSVNILNYVPNAVQDEEKKDESDSEEISQEEQHEELQNDMKWIAELRDILSNPDKTKDCTPLNLIQFEKDDPTNFHVEFVTAASNLRARAYGIPEADLQKTKGIAGNIIPAMITTTALTTGLVCLELYKLIQNAPLSKLKDSSINIALPHILQWEPKTAKPTLADRYTIWDQFNVYEKNLTFESLFKILREQEKLDVLSVTYGGYVLIKTIMVEDEEKLEKLMKTKIKTFVQALTRKYDSLPSAVSPLRLDIHGSDVGSNEIHEGLPPVLYHFPSIEEKRKKLLLAKKKAAAKKLLAQKKKT